MPVATPVHVDFVHGIVWHVMHSWNALSRRVEDMFGNQDGGEVEEKCVLALGIEFLAIFVTAPRTLF